MEMQTVPAKVHGKKRAKGHKRIQKKWNKRYGFAVVARSPGAPVPAWQKGLQRTAPRNRKERREQISTQRAAVLATITPEMQWEATKHSLAAEAEKMMERVRTDASMPFFARFFCATKAEADFLRDYMDNAAPSLPVLYYVAGQLV